MDSYPVVLQDEGGSESENEGFHFLKWYESVIDCSRYDLYGLDGKVDTYFCKSDLFVYPSGKKNH